jgi:hypothetical protein
MTPASFLAWRLRLGLDKRAAAIALGCSRNYIYSLEKPGAKIPLYIALAAAAIANGLGPLA